MNGNLDDLLFPNEEELDQEIIDAEYPDDEAAADLEDNLLYWRVSLDDLVDSPLRVNELPPEEKKQLLGKLPMLQVSLTSALLMEIAAVAEQQKIIAAEDVLLTPIEAAKILNVEPRWFHSHHGDYTVKISHKKLRISKRRLERYMAARVKIAGR